MASNNNARNQALQIANAEARANTQLKNAETAMNARIAQANLANVYESQSRFNTLSDFEKNNK